MLGAIESLEYWMNYKNGLQAIYDEGECSKYFGKEIGNPRIKQVIGEVKQKMNFEKKASVAHEIELVEAEIYNIQRVLVQVYKIVGDTLVLKDEEE